MPPKKKTPKARKPKKTRRSLLPAHARIMHGEGWFGDAVKSVGRFIKKNKLLSKGLSLIPHPAAQTASRVASTVGLGPGTRQKYIQVPAMQL